MLLALTSYGRAVEVEVDATSRLGGSTNVLLLYEYFLTDALGELS
jgi:hypothetical protein